MTDTTTGVDAIVGAPLLDALPDLALAFDTDQATRPIIWANRAAKARLGSDPVGLPLGAVLRGASAAIDQAGALRVNETATVTGDVGLAPEADTENQNQSAGAPLAMEARLVRVSPDIVVWLASDRTVEHAASAELRRSNFDLNQFAFVASHDLMEPLRMVTAYLDLISECYGDRLDAKGHQYLDFAVDGATRMRALIGDLLELARLDGTSANPHATVDLHDVAAAALGSMSVSLAETGAEVSVAPALPVVWGDRRQLVQLFANLLGNAVKFHSDAEARITVSGIATPDGRIRIEITDNGIGIDANQREAVFQMFRRLHPRSRYGGTGMGLAICKTIVDRHGGEIGIDAAPDRGTTVWFTLPAATNEGTTP